MSAINNRANMKKKLQLLGVVSKYAVLLIFALSSTATIGIFTFIRIFWHHPWLSFINETVICLDSSFNIFFFVMQFAFSRPYYNKFCGKFDRLFRKILYKRFGIKSQS